MAFSKKTWKNRESEAPTRRKITYASDGTSEIVTIERSEGEVREVGDAFNALNMNDLEDRIEEGLASMDETVGSAITEVNNVASGISSRISGITKLQRMTEAQWNALGTKPAAGIITFVREN